MIHYGELDTRINEGWPAYEKALKAAGTTYETYIYPGANHGFHNDALRRSRRQTGLGAHIGVVQQVSGVRVDFEG